MRVQSLVWLLAAVLVVSGCSAGAAFRKVLGVPEPGSPTITLKGAETRWLLIQNPRFGSVASEPEYVWVEEDNVPTTLKTLVRGKGSIVAPPEVVAQYGPPPGGGRISPRHGLPTQAAAEPRQPDRGAAAVAAAAVAAGTPVAENRPRGIVLYVDTTRIVVDLTEADGARPGALLSLRRDRIPIVHPVTGEVLGELDEEIATARVTETRDRFSVAEVQSVAPGATIQVKDRVVIK